MIDMGTISGLLSHIYKYCFFPEVFFKKEKKNQPLKLEQEIKREAAFQRCSVKKVFLEIS